MATKDKILTSFSLTKVENFGFNRVIPLDFKDDGASFKVFSYKGIPMSYYKSSKEQAIYLSIRDDYCKEKVQHYGAVKIAARKVPRNWWSIYRLHKNVEVTNILTGETYTDTIAKLTDWFNFSSEISLGWLIGICEVLLKEFKIAEKEFKKDIEKKRQDYESLMKEALEEKALKLGKFLEDFFYSFKEIKNSLTFFEHNRFEEYYKSLSAIKSKWLQKAESLTDEEFYRLYKNLEKNNWKLDVSEVVHM